MLQDRDFELYCPTRVKFGSGISTDAGAEIKALNGKKVLVIADPGIVAAGLLDGILESLNKADLPYAVFDEVEPNATLSKVQKASALQKEENCDILLCVGGGSTLDTAKGSVVWLPIPDRCLIMKGQRNITSLPCLPSRFPQQPEPAVS